MFGISSMVYIIDLLRRWSRPLPRIGLIPAKHARAGARTPLTVHSKNDNRTARSAVDKHRSRSPSSRHDGSKSTISRNTSPASAPQITCDSKTAFERVVHRHNRIQQGRRKLFDARAKLKAAQFDVRYHKRLQSELAKHTDNEKILADLCEPLDEVELDVARQQQELNKIRREYDDDMGMKQQEQKVLLTALQSQREDIQDQLQDGERVEKFNNELKHITIAINCLESTFDLEHRYQEVVRCTPQLVHQLEGVRHEARSALRGAGLQPYEIRVRCLKQQIAHAETERLSMANELTNVRKAFHLGILLMLKEKVFRSDLDLNKALFEKPLLQPDDEDTIPRDPEALNEFYRYWAAKVTEAQDAHDAARYEYKEKRDKLAEFPSSAFDAQWIEKWCQRIQDVRNAEDWFDLVQPEAFAAGLIPYSMDVLQRSATRFCGHHPHDGYTASMCADAREVRAIATERKSKYIEEWESAVEGRPSDFVQALEDDSQQEYSDDGMLTPWDSVSVQERRSRGKRRIVMLQAEEGHYV